MFLKLYLMNNLLSSIFYDYFHLLFSFGKVWIKNWKSFILCLSWHVAFLLVSGVTILLSLTVFHNIVTEKLPRVSTAMPLLGAGQFSQKSFCCFTMLMSVRQIVSHVFMTIKLPENKHSHVRLPQIEKNTECQNWFYIVQKLFNSMHV